MALRPLFSSHLGFLPPRLPILTAPIPHRPLITKASHGTLYIVSTPIGHIQDLSPRAKTILQSAHIIAAEDTRKTQTLLTLSQTPINSTILSCHEHNWKTRLPTLLSALTAGKSIALVSDAGTPCISDPGFQLVQSAITCGISVVPIPGPCSILAALVASGLPMDHFTFLGFLPRSGKPRQQFFQLLHNIQHTVVFYEAPHRLLQTLQQLASTCSDRKLALARELTKKYEQFLRFHSIQQAVQYFEQTQPRGEFTLVLGPKPLQKPDYNDLHTYNDVTVDVTQLITALVQQGMPPSSLAKALASVLDVPKKPMYSLAVQRSQELHRNAEESSTTK